MAANKRIKKPQSNRAANRASSDGFFIVHWKQAKRSEERRVGKEC